jgi:hypothetical protein
MQWQQQTNAVRRTEAFVYHIASVPCCGRLEQNDRRLFIRAGPVLHSARHHAILASAERDDAVSKLDSHLASPDQEHFVCTIVGMPRELTLELNELHFLSIELGDHLGPPMLRDA